MGGGWASVTAYWSERWREINQLLLIRENDWNQAGLS